MPDDIYLEAHPGDILTSANWNELQARIKADIQKQVKEAVDKLVKSGVERADNADKFDQRTPKDWTDDLDKRYAPFSLVLEGVAGYRRYIKEFTPDLNWVLLHHHLGRLPLVDVCVLCGVPGSRYDQTGPLADRRLLVYYGDEEADDFDLIVRAGRDKPQWLGVKLPMMLDELRVKYDDRRTLQDVINDMWTNLLKEPNDEVRHGVTPWVRDAYTRSRTVGSLREGGEWDDLRVGMRVERIPVGGSLTIDQAALAQNEVRKLVLNDNAPEPSYSVDISHVNYDTMLVQVSFDNLENLPPKTKVYVDLMILMRS